MSADPQCVANLLKRSILGACAGILLVCGPLAIAQQNNAPKQPQPNDAQWKYLMQQAMLAAGAKDYPKSEDLLQKAAKESEKFGTEDPRIGTSLNTLGLVYRAEKKLGESEAAYRRAMVVMEANYGEGLDVGNVSFNIAGVLIEASKPADALPYARRSVAIYRRLLGDSSLKTADGLCIEGDAYRLAKQFAEAEAPLRRCADIRESNGGIETRELAGALYSLALTYTAEGKLTAAEPRFGLAERIQEKTLGIGSPLLAQTMEEHAAVLKSLGRQQEADRLMAMSDAILHNQKKGK